MVRLDLQQDLENKHYSGASLEDRIDLLLAATREQAAFSVAVSDRGLFAEIAEECRESYGGDVLLSFLCGRDAAERIAGWDYGRPDAFTEMLEGFDLLVAPREGAYRAAAALQNSIRELPIESELAGVSSTEVRERIGRGEAWEDLVPAAIRERVRALYAPATE